MHILLVGGGGREDALAWAIAKSARCERIVCTPGNAGIARRAVCLDMAATDVDALVDHAVAERYDLVVVGPEAPLVAGLTDRLTEAGIPVFGPLAAAARLEGSKAFAKRFMERHDIPTAAFRVVDDVESGLSWLESDEARYPLVLKADGLAAGKGVVIAEDRDQAADALRAMMVERRFGAAGDRVVIEDCLVGREASFFVLADGTSFVELATCQDYKRARNGDAGPNTGGMGTYSPSAYLDEETRSEIVERIVRPTIDGLAGDGSPYRGVIFIGVMLTEDGPRVLEYNVRFGDPETQVLLPLLDGDWVELLHASAVGGLGTVGAPRWTDGALVCVVMTAGGYPERYETGARIRGLEDAERLEGVELFHAGTARDSEGNWVTAGGRVLGVTARGADLDEARRRAYEAVGRISWDDEHHRTDIAADAVEGAIGRKGP